MADLCRWKARQHSSLRTYSYVPQGITTNVNPFCNSNYLPLPLFALLFWTWKWKEGETTVDPRQMDIDTGRREIDQEERAYEEARMEARRRQPRQGILRRIWAHI